MGDLLRNPWRSFAIKTSNSLRTRRTSEPRRYSGKSALAGAATVG